MSFGSPTPVEVVIASPQLADAREYAERVRDEFNKIDMPARRADPADPGLSSGARSLIDREKAGQSGVTTDQVASRCWWRPRRAAWSPAIFGRTARRERATRCRCRCQPSAWTRRSRPRPSRWKTPVPERPCCCATSPRWHKAPCPANIDRTSMQRYLSVTANVEGEDLGRVASKSPHALEQAGTPPRGVRVDTRGQIAPMREMFTSLAIGLAIAVAVILVMLTAYFESPRQALVSIGAVPGVLSGVALMLYITGTTLNIESFMGTIMSIGVSVSNSVMLVTFTVRDWQQGMSPADAAIQGATRTAAADLDDGLRHDRRHGADGPGPGGGQRNAGAAGPSGDRRPAGLHRRDLADLARPLCRRHGPERSMSRCRWTPTTPKASITTNRRPRRCPAEADSENAPARRIARLPGRGSCLVASWLRETAAARAPIRTAPLVQIAKVEQRTITTTGRPTRFHLCL